MIRLLNLIVQWLFQLLGFKGSHLTTAVSPEKIEKRPRWIDDELYNRQPKSIIIRKQRILAEQTRNRSRLFWNSVILGTLNYSWIQGERK